MLSIRFKKENRYHCLNKTHVCVMACFPKHGNRNKTQPKVICSSVRKHANSWCFSTKHTGTPAQNAESFFYSEWTFSFKRSCISGVKRFCVSLSPESALLDEASGRGRKGSSSLTNILLVLDICACACAHVWRCHFVRPCGSVSKASAWKAQGPWFKPCFAHQVWLPTAPPPHEGGSNAQSKFPWCGK